MANNTFTKNYADGAALTESKLDAAYQSLKLDISNTSQMTQGATAGHYLKCVTPGAAAQFAAPFDPRGYSTIRNIGIKCTAATGALTFTLTTGAGSTPTSSDYATIGFSSAGTTQAVLQSIDVTSTKTLTLPSGATLGTNATTSTYIYLYAGKSATTSSGVFLGVSTASIYDNGEIYPNITIGTGSDAYGVIYSSSTVATSVWRLLGMVQVARNSSSAWQTPAQVSLSSAPILAVHTDANARDRSINSGSTAYVGGIAVSSSSGSFSTTSSSFTDVTNLSVTLPTTGRPVQLKLIPVPGTAASYVGANRDNGTAAATDIAFLRGTTIIAVIDLRARVETGSGSADPLSYVPPSCFEHIDFIDASTYTYKVQAKAALSSTTSEVANCRLVAYEI